MANSYQASVCGTAILFHGANTGFVGQRAQPAPASGPANDGKFNVREQAQAVLAAGGQFLACGTCLKLRSSRGSEICPLATLKDLYEIVRDSDHVLTF